ncbi:sulfite exporter TauE/SafE family protein [Micromonospora chalcea]|uniref:sulfite exporter TauE/SafE family protein n=1 Tax=Micromonospora chalcea TaxID=1874 RepID=UPI0033D6C865
MRKLLVLALVGLAAQLVDGSLGMAYGLTSSTLLLFAGVAPAAASASVHLAEIGTTLAAGVSHWRFGNVDWRVVGRIALPGAIGAFAGATFLSSISTEAAAPWMAAILFTLGAYLLVRFSRPLRATRAAGRLRSRFLAPLGLVAGFVDATGGGGWGPVATPALLVSGRMEPRKVIGSVDTSEFVVAGAASVGFLIGLGTEGFLLPTVAALLIGGLIAAPIAAWLVRIVPAQLLGAVIGGVIVLTNARTLLSAGGVSGSAPVVVYALLGVAWVVAIVLAVRALRRTRRARATVEAALASASPASASPASASPASAPPVEAAPVSASPAEAGEPARPGESVGSAEAAKSGQVPEPVVTAETSEPAEAAESRKLAAAVEG